MITRNNIKIKLVVFFFINILASTLTSQSITDEIKQQIVSQQKEGINIETAPESKTNIIVLPEEEKASVSSKYFGYDYFLNREALSLYDNFPVPNNYQLGPGDEIVIHIWGATQLQSTYTINREGYLFIDKLGQVSIIGFTLLEAKKYLKSLFESVFSTLEDPGATTYFNLTIGRLKSINVQLIGEVSSPGIHSLHPLSTISTSLVQSGGIKSTGTLRSIQLIRNGEVETRLDLYKFLISAEMIMDVRIQDGDIIFVPLRNSSVEISGEVHRSGIFELTTEENFENLLTYSGGLKINAQDGIEINRIIPIENREFEDFAHEIVIIQSSNLEYKLRDGDRVNVSSIYDVDQYINIEGMVKKPGKHPFTAGLTIMDILNVAGGINDDSFIQQMDLSKVEIVRRNKDNEYPDKFDINVELIINGDKSNNIKLNNWDIIHVRRNNNYKLPEKVNIDGEVKQPGDYALLHNAESIEEIIIRAGGYTANAYFEGIKVFRDNNQIILRDFDMSLLDDDSIFVPPHTSVVEVGGNVYHPGFVQYLKGEEIDYYIERAGGFTLDADEKKIMVIYANGDVKIKKRFFNPKIREGCHIVVQKMKEKDDFNLTEFLKESASILASLTTVIYIINSGS